jgi:hypothetical protein
MLTKACDNACVNNLYIDSLGCHFIVLESRFSAVNSFLFEKHICKVVNLPNFEYINEGTNKSQMIQAGFQTDFFVNHMDAYVRGTVFLNDGEGLKPRTNPDIRLFDCTKQCDICCLSMIAPCYVFFDTSQRAKARKTNGPCLGDSYLAGIAGLIGCLTEIPLIGCITACMQSKELRPTEHYCKTALEAACCYPCLLTKNWRSAPNS